MSEAEVSVEPVVSEPSGGSGETPAPPAVVEDAAAPTEVVETPVSVETNMETSAMPPPTAEAAAEPHPMETDSHVVDTKVELSAEPAVSGFF